MTTWKKLSALVAAGALVFALSGTATADPVWATVTDHAASTSDNNSADWWESYGEGYDECTKLNAGEGDLGSDVDTYVLGQGYALVVVKAGSTNQGDPNTLTLFANANAGETVWADYNPDNAYGDGDKNISHIIFCDPLETTTTTTTTTTEETTTTTTEETTTTTTFTQETSGETDVPTEPPTTTFGGGTSGPADGSWLLVLALGIFLASVVILTPARAKSGR